MLKVSKILTANTPIFRSVSPAEAEHIFATGSIQGGLNKFNDFDKRREVFFGQELTDNLIGQGEEIERRASYFLHDHPMHAEHAQTQKLFSKLAKELGLDTPDYEEKLQRIRTLELEMRKGNRELRPKLKQYESLKQKMDTQQSAYFKLYRNQVSIERDKNKLRPYTSIILEAHPKEGGNTYTGKGSGMGEHDEIGYPSNHITLQDVYKVHVVKDKKVIEICTPEEFKAKYL
jgi:hypothetical protein